MSQLHSVKCCILVQSNVDSVFFQGFTPQISTQDSRHQGQPSALYVQPSGIFAGSQKAVPSRKLQPDSAILLKIGATSRAEATSIALRKHLLKT